MVKEAAQRIAEALASPLAERLVKFLIFSVAVALLPLAFNYVLGMTKGESITLVEVIRHGELLLVAVAITATGVGELFASSSSQRVARLVAGGAAVVVLLSASLYFAGVAAATSASVKPEVVAAMSLWIFVFAVVVGGSCIVLAGAR